MKRNALTMVTLALTSVGCSQVQQSAQARYQSLKAGNLSVLLCEEPDLNRCKTLPNVSIAGDTVKYDVHDLRSLIGDNQIRSMQVSCGRPTNVTVFENCNFRGGVATYQCTPTADHEIATLEVRHFGNLAGKVTGLAFSERGAEGVLQLDHTAVPLWKNVGGKTPADLVADGVTASLLGTAGTLSATERATRMSLVPLIPQCAVPATSSSGGSGAAASATPISTQIYWTDEVNMPPETPARRPDGEAPTLSRGCLDSSDIAYVRRDLLAIRHSSRIRIHYPHPAVSISQPEYTLEMIWYFDPAIRQAGGATGTTQVALEVVKSAWTVDGQSAWDVIDNNTPVGWFADAVGLEIGPADAIANSVRDSVDGAGNEVACSILRAVKDGADAIIPNAGSSVLSERTRITFGYDTPAGQPEGAVPCNALASGRFACGNYRSAPPTIVLHR